MRPPVAIAAAVAVERVWRSAVASGWAPVVVIEDAEIRVSGGGEAVVLVCADEAEAATAGAVVEDWLRDRWANRPALEA